MFLVALVLLILGFRVAFVFGGVALAFAFFDSEVGIDTFELLPHRIYGIMQSITLISLPLFIFMGHILEKSGLAEKMLSSIGSLFGKIRGGVAVSVVVVGAVLAATMGVVGASVVMMSVISLPVMINQGYSKPLASGTIAAAGTLGQLMPPSVVLIILGSVMSISVGELFNAAILPALLLVGLYIIYILIYSFIFPSVAPSIQSNLNYKDTIIDAIKAIIPMAVLIIAVLGSIFLGIATPTEAAAVGSGGSMFLAALNRKLNLDMIKISTQETVKMSAMIFMILIGATAFTLVFNEAGGSDLIMDYFIDELEEPKLFILASMLLVFILGFFIDIFEIVFVVVPILYPIADEFNINLIWFAILLAMNLQTSFLTPPFGFSLFYLKGASSNLLKTTEIYKGVAPFIIIQLIAIYIVYSFPILCAE